MMTRKDRRTLFASALRSTIERPGALPGEVRRAAAEGHDVPEALDNLVRLIRDAAHAITDADVEAARRAGYDDDALFELTLATALGESRKRLAAIVRALGREE